MYGYIAVKLFLCIMKQTILCINGSDSSGRSGIQADIRQAADLNVAAFTAISSVTIQNTHGISQVHPLPADVILGQVRSALEDQMPQAVKIGMLGSADAISGLSRELVACRNIVCSPGILASGGGCLMSNDALHAFTHDILPLTQLLILKCTDAEILLGRRILSDADMQAAAQMLHNMGARWVMLRGGSFAEGSVTAMLSGEGSEHHFSSSNVQGWKQHGVVSAFSTAITCHLAQGDDVPTAIRHAHTCIHNKVVYAVDRREAGRTEELYNQFLAFLAEHYRSAHDVAFYASRLAIGMRYLSQVTNQAVGKSPKQVIDEYLLRQAELQLSTTTLSIQQIAHRLGFSSQITFSRFFRQKRGVSPRDFRNPLS